MEKQSKRRYTKESRKSVGTDAITAVIEKNGEDFVIGQVTLVQTLAVLLTMRVRCVLHVT
jgi:hypothetical protein